MQSLSEKLFSLIPFGATEMKLIVQTALNDPTSLKVLRYLHEYILI
jgi:hypothetical protein